MNKEIGGNMRKAAAIVAGLGLWLSAGNSAFCGEIRSFSASEAVASTTSAASGPAVHAVDGDPGTSWKLTPSATGGWLEVRLSSSVLMYGVELDGALSDGATLKIAYLDENGMKRPFAGGFVSSLNGTTLIDVSYERAVATAILIDLTQNAGGASAIREVRVIGEKTDEVSRIIEPVSLEASEYTSSYYPETFLFDGDPWTEWKASSTRIFDSVPDSVDHDFERRNHGRKRVRNRVDEFEAIARLGEVRKLDSIRVYVSEDLNGNVEIEAGLADVWETIGLIQERHSEGWYEIEAGGMAADAIRIVQSGVRHGSSEGIGEVEIRGRGGPVGDAYAAIGPVGPVAFSAPLNFSFEAEKENGGTTLEIGLASTMPSDLSIDFNGMPRVLKTRSVAGGTAVYILDIPSQDLWEGMNFLRIRGRSTTDVFRFVRLRSKRGWDAVSIAGMGPSLDGNLLTDAMIEKEAVYTLDGDAELRSIEVYSTNGLFPELSLPDRRTWKQIPLTVSEGARGVYRIDAETDKFKLIPAGARIAEVRVTGSPSRNRAPVVSFLSPESFSGELPRVASGDYFIGFVDNPNTSVSVNGRRVPTFGHYFWATPRSFDMPEDDILTIEATATDERGRTGRSSATVFVGDSNGIELDQEDIVHYSAATWTASGSCRLSRVDILINETAAKMLGRRFSGTATLEEGLNLVRISAVDHRGRTVASLNRKVVKASEPLTLTIVRPADGVYTRESSLSIKGLVIGAGKTSVTVAGKPCTVSGNEFTSEPIALVDGLNRLEVTAVDALGRQQTTTAIVYRDNAKPEFEITEPAAGAFLASGTVNIAGTIQDAGPTCIFVNGKAIDHDPGTFTTVEHYAEGSRSATVYAIDAAGNISERTTVAFTVDLTPPLPFTTTAVPSNWTNDTRPTISFSTTDAVSGIARYEVSQDGETWVEAQSPYHVAPLSDGERTIFVRAIDRAGNSRLSTVQVFIDTTAPAAPPSLKAIPGNGLVRLEWGEPSEDTRRYYISRSPEFEGGIVSVTGTEYEDTTTTVGATYAYAVSAVDRAENTGAESEVTAICGFAQTEYAPEAGSIVQYDNVNLMVPPFALSEEITKFAVFEVDSPSMRDAAMNEIVGPIYNFAAIKTVDGVETVVDDVTFDKEVLVQIAYDSALLPTEGSEDFLSVFYYDTQWGSWFRMPNVAIDQEHRTIFFATNHFTSFSVQATAADDLSPQELRESPYSPSAMKTKHEKVSVSPQGGGISTAMTELSLPGPNGFDFVLRRVYDTGTARRDARNLSHIATTNGFLPGRTPSPADFTALTQRIKAGNLTKEDRKLRDKIKNNRMEDGDYSYSMGKGWRLDLPYIRRSNSDYILRAPGGGEYSITTHMKLVGTSRTGDVRTLKLELHEDKDLTLYVRQSVAWKGDWPFAHHEYELLNWELVEKDGTSYEFKRNGCLDLITDPSGSFSIDLKYEDNELRTIIDARGRVISIGHEPGFGIPYILNISVAENGEPFTSSISYTRKEGSETLLSATDLGERTFTYTDTDPSYLVSGGVSATVSADTLLDEYGIELTDDGSTVLGSSNIKLKGNYSVEWTTLLASATGPGIGTTNVAYGIESVALSKDGKGILNRLKATTNSTTTSFIIDNRVTASQLTISNGGETAARTTNCTYNFQFRGEGQSSNTSTTISDERTTTSYSYDSVLMKYDRIDSDIDEDDTGSSSEVKEYTPFLTTKAVTGLTGEGPMETTRYTYDSKWRHVIKIVESRSATMNRTRDYAYDTWGNVISETTTDSASGVTRTTTSEYLHNAASPNEYFSGWPSVDLSRSAVPADTRNLLYRRKETGNGAGLAKYEYAKYDGQGRLTESARYRKDRDDQDGTWRTTQYAYDPTWNEISQITDPAGHITAFAYDQPAGADRTVTRREKNVPLADGTLGDIETKSVFDYNSGLKIAETDGRNFTTTYTYDALGRLKTITKPNDGDGTAISEAHYTDSDSTLTVVTTDPEGATGTYGFDTLGRLASVVKTVRTRDALGNILSGYSSYVTTAGYDGWDQVTSIVDPRNNTTSYKYDAGGRLSVIQHPDGTARTMHYTYSQGLLTTTDERGSVTTEDLDMDDRVLKRTRKDGKDDIVETFTYDGFGREITKRLKTGTESDDQADTTATTYDQFDNVLQQTLPSANFFENGAEAELQPVLKYDYDAAGRLAAEVAVGPSGDVRIDYQNDDLGRRIKIEKKYTDYTGSTPEKKTAVTAIRYDEVGHKIAEIDPNGKETTWEYSPRGNLLSVTSPGGATTRYAYDKADRMTTMTDPRGTALGDGAFSIDYRYDDIGRLIVGILPSRETTRPTVRLAYDARGNLAERTEADGGVVSYEYDSRNRPAKEIQTARYSNGTTRTFTSRREYDGLGNEIKRIDGLNRETVKQYDPIGRLSETRSPEGVTENYAYDKRGNLVEVKDGRGATTVTEWDPFGRPVKVTDGEGGIARTSYDRLGRVTRTIDELGRVTLMNYDELGRLIQETRADGSVRKYAYDAIGNLMNAFDPRGTKTVNAYDDEYRLTSATRTNGSVSELSRYTYDLAGDLMWSAEGGILAEYNTESGSYIPDAYGRTQSLRRTIDGKTFTVGYDYDTVGRTTAVAYPSGRNVAYSWDTSGRLERVGDFMSESIGYDNAGRISSMTAANGVRLDAERDGDGRLKKLAYAGIEEVASFSLSYDDAGNIVRRNDSSYTYDRTNRLTIANERGRFAAEAKAEGLTLGRMEGDYAGEKELDFEAEEADVLLDYGSMSIGVDLGAEFEVARIELDPKVTGHRIDVNRMEFLYATFNEEGNWKNITDAVFEKTASGTTLVRLRKPLTARYLKLHCFYDDLGSDGKAVDRATVRNPLVKVGYFEKTRDERYAYDAKGNRKTVTTTFAGKTRNASWTYWPNTDRVKSDGKWGYAYDANGNLTEKGTVWTEEDGKLVFSETEGEYIRYEYDLANRMTRVLRGDAGTASAAERATYRYGPDGLRIAKTTSSGTRYYVYGIDGNELTETAGNASTDTVWVLGKKYAETVVITDTESRTVTETRTYLATDQVGSVVAATDETGKVIWQGSRTAFGEDGGEVGLAERVASYTGKDYDEESGLLYFNARWYDSGLARFTTEDPIRDGANWYAYCGNNPMGSTDPSGLNDQDALMTAAAWGLYSGNPALAIGAAAVLTYIAVDVATDGALTNALTDAVANVINTLTNPSVPQRDPDKNPIPAGNQPQLPTGKGANTGPEDIGDPGDLGGPGFKGPDMKGPLAALVITAAVVTQLCDNAPKGPPNVTPVEEPSFKSGGETIPSGRETVSSGGGTSSPGGETSSSGGGESSSSGWTDSMSYY